MTNALESAKSLREEIDALFGVRWDTAIEWAVIIWLSAWFWTSFAERPPLIGLTWSDGPLSGTQRFLQSAGLGRLGWLDAIIDWLARPNLPWLVPCLTIAAVVSCVGAVRSYRLSGLRTLALISAALLCQTAGSLTPILFVLLLAGVPAAVASLLGIRQMYGPASDRDGEERDGFYLPEWIVVSYGRRIVLLFVAPVFAPLLLARELVKSFRISTSNDPIERLNVQVRDRLSRHHSQRVQDLDAFTAQAAAVAVQLSGMSSPSARRIASSYLIALQEPIGAVDLREAANRWRS